MGLYSSQVSVRPLPVWPHKEGPRRNARFGVPTTRTLQLLDHEVRQVGGERILIHAGFGSSTDIRNDGWPRATARTLHPGVIVSFDSDYGTLTYATDEFATWFDNIRAIAKGLEALRAIDRWGVTRKGEQYRGFAALPASAGGEAIDDVIARVLHFSLNYVKSQLASDRERDIVNLALKAAHPDHGGDADDFGIIDAYRRRM